MTNQGQQDLKVEQIRMLYQNNHYGWLGLIMLWTGISFAYNFPGNIAFYMLSGLLLAGVIAHYINQFSYIRYSSEGAIHPHFWKLSASVLSGFNGLVIGLSPWLLLDLNDLSKVYLVSALIVLPLFGSSVVSGTVKSVHLCWTITSALPLIILLISSQQREFIIMAFMLLLAGLPSAILMNLYFYKLFVRSITLQNKNRDLLQNIQKQKQLVEHESHEKSRFLAATSHDLRQPLHALNLFLGALKLKLNKKNQQDLLAQAQASSQSLNELLNALMDISRFDAGDIEVDPHHFDLSALIKSIIGEYHQQAREKQIDIKINLHEVIVYTDPVLLARMIRNIVSNAINHNEQCELSLYFERRENQVHLHINDTGKGIEYGEHSNIFSEFYQLNNPGRDRSKGLGLGLAIVKRLSQLLELPLQFNSEPGNGARFTLIIDEDDSITQSNKFGFQQEQDLTGVFVIIVDDEVMIRSAIKELLRSWDCEVLLAESSQSLLTELKANHYARPDLIISDYRLGNNKTGVDVIKTVRQFFQYKIPAMMITGDASQHILQEAEAIDAKLLLKPLNSEELRSAIENSIHA